MVPIKKKTRPVTASGSGVGTQRYDLYLQAYERVDVAVDRRFYLEAITLVDSLIVDRLESRLTKVLGTDFSLKTLDALIEQSKQSEPDEILRNLVAVDLDQWHAQRNQSIHELVKVKEGDTSTWEERNRKLKPIAVKGFELLKQIAARTKTLRRMEQKGEIPAAGTPPTSASTE
jgi:hypothetical protein